MASLANATATLRVRSAQNRAVCTISGINPNVSAAALAGFVKGIQTMYNRGPVTARLHTVVELDMDDDPG